MPPTPIPPATLIEALNWRYATKRFDGRKIPADTWSVLEQALILSPSSAGLQPWKFVIVQDEETRKKLSAAAHGQAQPLECSHFVVFAARKGYNEGDIERFFQRVSEVRKAPMESLKDYRGMVSGAVERARAGGYLDLWLSRQPYIALGGFMTAAALLGVDTCPMEGIEPAKFDEILGLASQGYGSLCACAAGYRSANDKNASFSKVRFKSEDVIIHI